MNNLENKVYKYIRYPGFKQKAVTLSYDDGVRQDKRLISIMLQYGLKGTFNINGGKFDATYDGVTTKGRMTKQEAIELYASSGMEVSLHGYRHLSLAEVASELAVDEIVSDRKELENTFGRVINGMAYANGSYNDEIVEILQKLGIVYARTTLSTEGFDLPTDWLRLAPTCRHNNPRLMELAKEFVEEKEHWYYWGKKLRLFYLWGHSFEFDNDNNWDVIESFAEYIGNRDDIWYATNGEIFEYLQAVEQLLFSMDGSFVKNPTSVDVYVDFLGTKRVIPAGKTVRMEDGVIV